MRYLAILPVLLALFLPARLPAQYSRRPVRAATNAGPYGGPAVTFNGKVKALSKKELILDVDRPDPDAEPETVTFRVSKKTKFLKGDQPIKPSDINVGMHISLEATRDGDLKMSALNVMLAAPDKPDDQPAGKPEK
ncbi:MAG: hypothetical protein ABSF54_04540 [Bryobacteraceae bacterium]|jgi:hypothetical protein